MGKRKLLLLFLPATLLIQFIISLVTSSRDMWLFAVLLIGTVFLTLIEIRISLGKMLQLLTNVAVITIMIAISVVNIILSSLRFNNVFLDKELMVFLAIMLLGITVHAMVSFVEYHYATKAELLEKKIKEEIKEVISADSQQE